MHGIHAMHVFPNSYYALRDILKLKCKNYHIDKL